MQADTGQHRIFVSSITLVEVIYLVEKGRLKAPFLRELLSLVETIGGSYSIAALNVGTAQSLQTISRDIVPDMPDRIIAATAHQLGLPLITRDEKIGKINSITVVW
jgi:predicted nucleic acid-binding protein